MPPISLLLVLSQPDWMARRFGAAWCRAGPFR